MLRPRNMPQCLSKSIATSTNSLAERCLNSCRARGTHQTDNTPPPPSFWFRHPTKNRSKWATQSGQVIPISMCLKSSCRGRGQEKLDWKRKLHEFWSESDVVFTTWWLISGRWPLACCMICMICMCPCRGQPVPNKRCYIYIYLVGGWALPLWKIWKSVGMMTFPIYGK